MKIIIEFTAEQLEELNDKRGNLPLPTFLKLIFKFRSVEVIHETELTESTDPKRHWLQDELYELDTELSTI